MAVVVCATPEGAAKLAPWSQFVTIQACGISACCSLLTPSDIGAWTMRVLQISARPHGCRIDVLGLHTSSHSIEERAVPPPSHSQHSPSRCPCLPHLHSKFQPGLTSPAQPSKAAALMPRRALLPRTDCAVFLDCRSSYLRSAAHMCFVPSTRQSICFVPHLFQLKKLLRFAFESAENTAMSLMVAYKQFMRHGTCLFFVIFSLHRVTCIHNVVHWSQGQVKMV